MCFRPHEPQQGRSCPKVEIAKLSHRTCTCVVAAAPLARAAQNAPSPGAARVRVGLRCQPLRFHGTPLSAFSLRLPCRRDTPSRRAKTPCREIARRDASCSRCRASISCSTRERRRCGIYRGHQCTTNMPSKYLWSRHFTFESVVKKANRAHPRKHCSDVTLLRSNQN